MRPVVPDQVVPRARKPSYPADPSGSTQPAESQHAATAAAVPETFFLARDKGSEDSMATSRSEGAAGEEERPGDSMYGVQSLRDSINESTESPGSPPQSNEGATTVPSVEQEHEHEHEQTRHHDHPALRRIAAETAPLLSRGRRHPDDESSSSQAAAPSFTAKRGHAPQGDVSTPLPITPLILGSPAEPVSLPSSPKSTSTRSARPSEDISLPDAASTHAVQSDDDEDQSATQSYLQDSAPQLVMPSIKMPSRRPFTERGKAMGRLKVLVAGAAGSGKTSLLKSIVQLSEDIVHVDPLPPHSSHPDAEKLKRPGQKPKARPRHTKDQLSISEIYASTKPYPSWWSDLEDSRVLRRRKSMGDVVLERNLCFVDNNTGGKRSRAEMTESLVQYIVQQLSRALGAIQGANSDLQGLLAGNGGSQVDVVLYLVSEETMSADIESVRRLAQFTNVVPLISKADTLSPEEIRTVKQLFLDKSADAGVQPFLFGGTSPNDCGDASRPQAPFPVSSANATDNDTMDASTLMSPDYVQPLMPSELGFLIDELFDRDNLAWLRHSASKKLIQSQHARQAAAAAGQTDSISPSTATTFQSRITPRSRAHPSVNANPTSYTLARVTDHTQREEHLAQARLAKWASDLQRSLQNERKRYEALARNERAVWLTERLGECVVDGTLVPITETAGFSGGLQSSGQPRGDRIVAVASKDGRRLRHRATHSSDRQDPLGVIRWNDELRRHGWILVQVVGSVGMVGGLALWMARVWGLSSQSSSSSWTLAWLNGCS